MEDGRKVVLGMMIISIFVLIVGLSSFYIQTQIETGNVCGCFIPIPLFVPFLASVGLFTGTMIYNFFSPKFESKKINKDVILKIFENCEQSIINFLLDNDGKTTQSKIVKGTAFSKVKVFRILERLHKKGIIHKEHYGKTNLIMLNQNLRDLLQ